MYNNIYIIIIYFSENTPGTVGAGHCCGAYAAFRRPDIWRGTSPSAVRRTARFGGGRRKGTAGGEKHGFVDLNPTLLALFYLSLGTHLVEGFGFELGYERDLSRNFACMGDVKYLRLSQGGVDFHVGDIGLYGRYRLWHGAGSAFFTSLKAGALLYSSPYFSGGTFVTGIEISWKYVFGAHLVLEPYISHSVSTEDRHIMPFTFLAITELLVPGFTAGIRLGFAF
jgi:hypothetical protein